MIDSKGAKLATRGQRQIHEENQRTLLYYSIASLITAALVLVSNLLLVMRPSWVGWAAGSILQALAVGTMFKMTKSVRNEKRQVVDAGLDLNDPHAFGEYCKDTIILCSLAHFLSLLSLHFYWLLVLIPIYALYKLWVNILAPWFFAQPMGDSDGDAGEGKNRYKRREKKVTVRR